MVCEKNHGYDMKVDAVVLVFEDVSSSSLVKSLSYYFYSLEYFYILLLIVEVATLARTGAMRHR